MLGICHSATKFQKADFDIQRFIYLDVVFPIPPSQPIREKQKCEDVKSTVMALVM
jgi:hypothetical protein